MVFVEDGINLPLLILEFRIERKWEQRWTKLAVIWHPTTLFSVIIMIVSHAALPAAPSRASPSRWLCRVCSAADTDVHLGAGQALVASSSPLLFTSATSGAGSALLWLQPVLVNLWPQPGLSLPLLFWVVL